MKAHTRLVLSFLIASAAPLMAACARQPAPSPRPLKVEVVPVLMKDVPVVSEWIGTLDGSVNAEIRPKVEGYVLRQLYREGQLVRRNDPLFEIDSRQFAAALEQARGTLAQAEAQLAKASKDVERFTPLAEQRAVSRQELDNALASERDARGGLAAARAAEEQAELNLQWTKVRSPIDGIVGIAVKQVGDLVNTQTAMTTVSTVDPIRVSFSISELEYMARAEYIRRGYATNQRGPAFTLELILGDGTVYPEKSQTAVVDREVNTKTGTLTAKALFPNPHDTLRPGQYARVRAAFTVLGGALVVPERAVTELQGSARVAVAGSDGKADIRSVELGPHAGDLWVVTSGLRAGENVIVSGLQHVRSGMPIAVTRPAPAPAKPLPATEALR